MDHKPEGISFSHGWPIASIGTIHSPFGEPAGTPATVRERLKQPTIN
jgi:hypothetical protein